MMEIRRFLKGMKVFRDEGKKPLKDSVISHGPILSCSTGNQIMYEVMCLFL